MATPQEGKPPFLCHSVDCPRPCGCRRERIGRLVFGSIYIFLTSQMDKRLTENARRDLQERFVAVNRAVRNYTVWQLIADQFEHLQLQLVKQATCLFLFHEHISVVLAERNSFSPPLQIKRNAILEFCDLEIQILQQSNMKISPPIRIYKRPDLWHLDAPLLQLGI